MDTIPKGLELWAPFGRLEVKSVMCGLNFYRHLAVTLPERFAVLQSVSPTGLTSWTAIAWTVLTKQPLAEFVGLFGCGRNVCRKRSGPPLVVCLLGLVQECR